ncbi:MAG: L-alanine-DL-glutamate epimerase-like enolase superfamily enzyme [Thermoleophilia bacterium]|nr:L-alanine-DL-glutamate epimerase-like enolase superfamily enzyme [Thermoleophilia bacterium]
MTSTQTRWSNRVGVAARLRQAIADLPVEVEQLTTSQLRLPGDFARTTTLVNVHGSEQCGTGEDIAYSGDTQAALPASYATLDIAGSWTLRELSTHLDSLSVGPPKDPHSDDKPGFHRWAVESALLDLALRQSGTDLATLIGDDWRPVEVSLSMGLGDPAGVETLELWLDRDSSVTFKLDTSTQWTETVVGQLAQLPEGAVTTVDFKGLYTGDWKQHDVPDPALYARVASHLPGALIEDAKLTAEVRAELAAAGALDRLSWDYPITAPTTVPGVRDSTARYSDLRPGAINIKPSRSGAIDTLLATIETCDAHGIPCYSGGQFELGVGRTQVQSIASLCFPSGPNDCAPVMFHGATPKRLEAVTGPVTPPAGHVGFGWDAPTPALDVD